jgi:hypothetical protein
MQVAGYEPAKCFNLDGHDENSNMRSLLDFVQFHDPRVQSRASSAAAVQATCSTNLQYNVYFVEKRLPKNAQSPSSFAGCTEAKIQSQIIVEISVEICRDQSRNVEIFR